MTLQKRIFIVLLIALNGACGYSLYNSDKPNTRLLEEQGIRTVYVKPLVNNTYKPGIENVVYNELVKSLNSFKRIRLVTSEEDADAVLSGTVGGAEYAPNGTVALAQLFPFERGSGDRQVAVRYSARLSCAFSLARRKLGRGQSVEVWSGGFDRGRDFPGNNQVGMYGATSALINESEFDRALKEMAASMMGDLNESMLNRF